MRCPECGVESAAGAKFCSECGARLPAGCPRCGSPVAAGAKFCSECGLPQGATPSASSIATSPTGAATSAPASLEAQFAAMQRAMPTSVRDRLVVEGDGENRMLTILFADLTGSTKSTAHLAPEDGAARVNDVLKAMIDGVLEYDGRINRLLGDAVLAFFGTPIAHENDPERAILAALRIREAVQRLGFDVTVGINTGEVYLGAVGSDAYHEVTAMGTAIVLAERLRERARPGEILVGAATHQHARGAFAFAERSIEAKGFAEPVPAYRVEARLARPDKVRGIEGLRADLIGRDEELGRLREALAAVRAGRGQMVTLVGEGGVGKSRLVADLRDEALADPDAAPRWLEGRSLDVSMGVSYWPFLDLLRAFVGWTIEDDEAGRGQRLVAALESLVEEGSLDAARLGELVPLLADLLSVDLGPEWPPVAHASPEQARQQTFVGLRDLVLALARGRGLVLVLDDLHWSDPLSLDVVSLLMEAITLAPLMLVCVYRPDREHKVWHLAASAARKCAGRHTEIQLRELSPEQSRRMIASLLKIDDLPPAAADLILEKGQGNPFFVEEVVRGLIDTGFVYREDDAWRARPEIEAVAVPASIQSVILSRVDRLQEDARRVLQSASVIGRVFRRRLLAHVTAREADLDKTLWELEERALIYEGRVTPEPEYAFQHQLTQETVYRNLLRRQREAFHGAVAAAIEALYADGLDEFYEQLAYHYERAGAAEQALAYLTRAAEKAVEQNALQQAIAFCDRAIALAPAGRAQEDLRLRRASARLDLFQGHPAVADYEAVLETARPAGDWSRELAGMLGLGRALYVVSLDDRAGDAIDRSRAIYEAAYELARQLGDKRAMVRALMGTQWMMDTWPEYRDRVGANAREAVALCDQIDDERLRRESRMWLARHVRREEAIELEREVLADLEARRDLPQLNMALFSFGGRRMNWGDLDESIAHADRAIEVAGQLGVPPVQYPTFKAVCLLHLGRYREAWASLQGEVADDEHPFGRTVRDLGIGLYLVELFADDRAADLLADVAERARALRRLWLESWAEARRALALARAGRGGEIGPTLFDVESGLISNPRVLATGAEVALAEGRVEEALRRARAAAAYAAEQDAARERAAALTVAARALADLGQGEEALATSVDPLAVAEAKGYRPLVWRLRAARARALAALGRAAEAEQEWRRGTEIVLALCDEIDDEELRGNFLDRASAAAALTD